MTIADSIASRVSQMLSSGGDVAASDITEAATSDSGAEGSPNAPHAAGEALASESGAAASGEAAASTTEQAGADASQEAEARKTKYELLQEKLREARERRQAQRVRAEALSSKAQAEADRKAAADERAKWEALRSGNFKDAITAMGRDPGEVFREMQEEAKAAGTPEAVQKRMLDMFERQMREKVEPLKQEIEDLKAERAQLAVREETSRFRSEFQRVIIDDQYQSLREEYDDGEILDFAFSVKDDLTKAGKRFTIIDVLSVLKSAQDEHNAKKEARRTRLQTAKQSPAAQAASEKPTVNGTAERRNAGTTLGNHLASERASGSSGSPRQTRAERIRRMIDDGES